MMKSVLLVVLLAAAATAAVVSNDVADVVELPAEADVDVDEVPQVVVTDVLELINLADVTDASEETGVATRRNLNVGTPTGTRIYNVRHIAGGVAGHHVVRDITIRTNTRITAVRVTRIGDSRGATPSIVSGGVGYFFVTIRIRSATDHGFDFRVEVFVAFK